MLTPSGAHGADAIVFPDVRAVPTVLAKLEVIDVGSRTRFPDEDEFVLAAVKASHTGVALGPNNKVFEFTVDGVAGSSRSQPSGYEHDLTAGMTPREILIGLAYIGQMIDLADHGVVDWDSWWQTSLPSRFLAKS